MKKSFCITVVRVFVVAALLSVTAWAAVQPTVKASASPNVRLNPSQMINMYDGKPKTVTVLDAPQDSTFQWYKDEDLIPAATEKKLTLEGDLSDNGIYRCVVTSATGTWNLECNVARKPGIVTFKVEDQNVAPGTFTEEQIRFLQETGVTSRSAEAAEYDITIGYSYSGLQEHVLELLDNGGVTLKLGEKQICDGVVFYPYELAYTENMPEGVGQKLKSNYIVTFEEGKGLYIKPVPTIVWSDEAQSEGITATYIGTGVSVQPSVEYFKVTDGISTTTELTDGEKSYRFYAIVNVVGDGAETYRSTIQDALSSKSIDVELGEMFEMSLDLPGKVLADELKKLLFLDWEAMNADLTIDYYAKAVYAGGNTHVGAESEDYVKLTVVPAPLTIKFKNQIIQKDDPLPTLQSLGIGKLELEGNAELLTNLTNTGELVTLTEQLEALAYQGKIVIGGLPEDSATSGRYHFALQLSGMTEDELDDLNPCLDIRFGTSELGIRGPVTIDFKAAGVFTLKDADEKYNPDGIFKTFVTTFTGGPILLTAENIVISEPGWDGDITFLYHDEVDGDSLYKPDNFGDSGNYYVKVTAAGDDLFEETVAYALVSVLPAELIICAKNQDIEYGQMLETGISAIELKGDILSDPIMNGMLQEALPLLLQAEAIEVKLGVEANIVAAGTYTDGIEVAFDSSKLAGSGYESAVTNFDIKTVSGDLIVKQKEVGLKWLELTAEELVYDGNAKVVTAEATGIVVGDDCAVTVALVGGNARNAGDNVNAGDFIYEATALSNNNYKLPNDSAAKMSPVYTITRKEVTVSAGSYKVSKVYDSTFTAGTASGELAVSGILDGDSSVTVMATPKDFSTANVGEQFSVNVTLALNGDTNNNYVLKETSLCVPCEITKADYSNTISANMTVRANKKQTGLTFDLTDQLSGIDGAEIKSVAYGSNEKHLLAGVPSGSGKVVTYHVNNGTAVGDIGVIEVTVSSINYKDFVVEIIVTAIGKDTLTIVGVKMDAETYTYGGAAVGYNNTGLSVSGFTGVEFNVDDLEYVYSGIRSDALTYEESSTAPTYPGSYTLTVRVPEDNTDYSGKQDISFEVDVKKITRPVQADAVVYNGADQTYGVASTADYIVADGVQKDANENGYNVTIELADPVFTTWDDDTIDNLTHKFIINKKTVTVTAGTYAVSKVYDGTTSAGTPSGALSIDGILETDSGVTVAATPAEYSDANVGGQTSVDVALTLNGDTNQNYVLASTSVSVPCEITKAAPNVLSWPILAPIYVNDRFVSVIEDGLVHDVDGIPLAGGMNLGEIDLTAAGSKQITVTFISMDENYSNTETQVSVTVRKRTVESVETLDSITNQIYGATQAELCLPATVEITVSGDKKFTVPVVWSGYIATDLEEQTLTGTLDLSAIAVEVEQPSPTVTASIRVDLQEKTAEGFAFGVVGAIYNGAPIAHTLPDGLEGVASVAYSYEGIGGTVYPASPNAPTHVGIYRVTATITMEPGYAAVEPKTGELTVAPREVTVTAGTYKVSKVYDGTTSAGTGGGELSIDGILETDSGVTVGAQPVVYADANVGGQTSVDVNLTLNGNINHNYVLVSATVSVPCEITKAVPAVTTWPTLQPVYVNDSEVTLNDDGAAEDVSGLPLEGSFALDVVDLTDSGTKTVTLTFTPTDSVNYEILEKTDYTVNVFKRTVESVQTLDAITNQLYGTAQAELGLTADVEITVSGDKKFTVPVMWSGYTATDLEAQTLTGTLNLSAIAEEVEQPSPAVSASVLVDLQEKTAAGFSFGGVGAIYNGAPIAHTLPDGLEGVASVAYSYEGIGGTVYPTSPNAPTHVGIYRVTATITMEPGYAAVEPKTGELTIAPREVTVTAGTYAISKVYDGTTSAGTPGGELVVSGILETDSGVTVGAQPAAYSNVNVGGQNAVDVALTLNGDTNQNYVLAETTLSVPCEITKAVPTVTAWPTVQSVYVNDSEVTLNGDGAAEDVSCLPLEGSFALDVVELTASGTKTVTLTFAPADSVNYESVEKTDYTVTVLKRTVESVQAPESNTNRLYGTAQAELGLPAAVEITVSGDKKFTVPVVWSGYTATDLEEQTLTGTLDLSAIAEEVEQPSPAVTASIRVDLQEKSAAGFGFGSMGVIYNGLPVAHTLPNGLEGVASVAYSYEGIDGTVYPASPTAPTHVGTYQVTATITMEPGYAAVEPKTATLTIEPKEVELNWSALSTDELVYSGNAKALTATASGLVDGDVCAVTVELVGDNVNVGSFHYTAKALSSADYTLTTQVDSPAYTITAKEVTVTADDLEMQAGSALSELTYTVEGLLGGDSLSTLPGCSTDANLNRAGTYTITISDADAGSNYTIVHVNGTLTVTGFPVVIRPVYEVKVAQDIPGGAVRADRITVYQNENITLTVRAEDGYELDELTVIDGQGNKLDVAAEDSGVYTFRMPADSVAVSARFVLDGSAETCTGESECPLRDYTDLDPAEWYHNGVHYCIENSLMTGFGDGLFGPDESTTRAMVAVILWNLEGNPVVNYAMNFPDVEEGQWYTEAIRWMRAEGIVVGYGDGRFGTDDAITREQLVTILWNYARYKGVDVSEGEDTNILSYGDALDVADYAVDAMQWACGSGVVYGKNAPDGTGLILDPAGMGTRVQIATMIMNFCVKVIGR